MIYGKGLKMSIHSGWEWVVGISELNQDHQQYPPPQNLPRPPNLRMFFHRGARNSCANLRYNVPHCSPEVQRSLGVFCRFFSMTNIFSGTKFYHPFFYHQKKRGVVFFQVFLDFRREYVYIYIIFNKYIYNNVKHQLLFQFPFLFVGEWRMIQTVWHHCQELCLLICCLGR